MSATEHRFKSLELSVKVGTLELCSLFQHGAEPIAIVDYDFEPAEKGRDTLRNGDPGYPGYPARVRLNAVKFKEPLSFTSADDHDFMTLTIPPFTDVIRLLAKSDIDAAEEDLATDLEVAA